MPSQKYDDGSDVMGRWPGSNLYYEVQIVSFDPSSQLYTVRYKDGTELDLKDGDIRTLGSFRTKKRSSTSPSRRRSRSRSRSPARTKSPGRTPKKVQQLTPVPATRDSRRGDFLKVRLTPLRLEDFSIGKSNGEAESIGKTVDFLREHMRTDVEKEDYLREPLRSNLERADYFRETLQSNAEREDYFRESLHSNKEREEKAVEEVVRSERVLRYKRKPEDYIKKDSNNIEVVKTKPEDVKIKPEDVKTKPAGKTASEFGRTIGTFFISLCFPLLLYYLLYQCTQKNVSLLSFYPLWTLADLWNPTVLGYFALWMLLHALFYLLPIGKFTYGMPLANGKRMKYRTHGLYSFFLVAGLVAVLWYNQVNLLYVYKHLHQFAAAATLFGVAISVYTLAHSYRVPREDLSETGKSGNFIYTFFVGRELNPHIGNIDLKYFSAIQSPFIVWVFLNFVMVLAEMDIQKLDKPSISMILVNAFQLIYVINAVSNQEPMFTSLEFVNDGFGFIFVFESLVFVPFTYSLQAMYLVHHPVHLSCTVIAAIVTLYTLGFLLFRYSNNQKSAFRKNPDDPKLSHLKTIQTSAGSKLIVSGLWGRVRHPNYLGDLMIAWAWCLPCGFTSVLPYFYGFFLTALLLHRVIRVEQQCKTKYGPDWQKYCQHVPYRLFPYIY